MEPTRITGGVKRGGVRDDRDAGGWSTGELEQAGEADWGEHKKQNSKCADTPEALATRCPFSLVILLSVLCTEVE